ncbi:Uncharacterised protein g4105 [Pycnogonum litorale]
MMNNLLQTDDADGAEICPANTENYDDSQELKKSCESKLSTILERALTESLISTNDDSDSNRAFTSEERINHIAECDNNSHDRNCDGDHLIEKCLNVRSSNAENLIINCDKIDVGSYEDVVSDCNGKEKLVKDKSLSHVEIERSDPSKHQELKVFDEVSAVVSLEVMTLLSNNLSDNLQQFDGNITVEATKTNNIKLSGDLMSIINIQKFIQKLLNKIGTKYVILDKVSVEDCCQCKANNQKPRRNIGRPKGKQQKRFSDVHVPVSSDLVSRINHVQTRSQRKSCSKQSEANDIPVNGSKSNDVRSKMRNDLNEDDVMDVQSKDEEQLMGNCSLSDERSLRDVISPTTIKEMNEESSYVSHVGDSSSFKYSCESCSYKSNGISHMDKHEEIHKFMKVLSCSSCEFSTLSSVHLKLHQRLHSSDIFKCKLCSYCAPERKLLAKHEVHKHGTRNGSQKKCNKAKTLDRQIFHCRHCNYETSRPKLYKRHLKRHQVWGVGSSVNFYECEECKYRTKRKEHFVRHMKNVHTNVRPFLCDLCGNAFKRADTLRHHVEVIHKVGLNQDAEKCTVKCDKCSKICRSVTHLREHLSVHSEERSFLCEICGASFKRISNQRKHVMNIHSNPRAHVCKFCDKRFNTAFAVRRHIKFIHTNDRAKDTSIVTREDSGAYLVTMVDPSIQNIVNSCVEEAISDPLNDNVTNPNEQAPSSSNIINVTSLNDIVVNSGSAVMAEQIIQVTNGGPTAIAIEETLDTHNSSTISNANQPCSFIQTSEAGTALLYLTTNFT